MMTGSWNLQRVVRAIEFLGPLHFADDWDNVGLLTEPSGVHKVERLMLTNDLTEEVVDEAIHLKADMIVSYHPPIFSPFKRLTSATWKGRCLIKCIEKRIAVYSPHTCWDAAAGGVNDWLALAFKNASQEEVQTKSIIKCSTDETKNWKNDFLAKYKVVCKTPEIYEETKDYFRSLNSGSCIINDSSDPTSPDLHQLELVIRGSEVLQLSIILKESKDSIDSQMKEVVEIPPQSVGMGRLVTLSNQLNLGEVVQRIKSHLKLKNVRLAIGQGKTTESLVSTVALCAGSGSSVFKQAGPADVYWTGEMSHHDVLDVVQRGISVVLCEHSNTERGFLLHLQPRLTSLFDDKIEVVCSKADAESLNVV